jgi:hypothetical protein
VFEKAPSTVAYRNKRDLKNDLRFVLFNQLRSKQITNYKPFQLLTMKTTKQLVLLALAFGAFTFSSCKKKDVAPAVSITATVDGTATNFNVNAAALQGPISGVTYTNITGSTTFGGATLSMTLAGTVTAGKTYSDAVASDNDMPLFVYATSATSEDDFYNDDDNASNLPSVTITSVTSTTIDGTFKGLIQNGSGATKSIANGKFHVNIKTHP